VDGGIALPEALEIAGDSVASPTLKADTHKLIGAVESGQVLAQVRDLNLILPSLTAALDMAMTARNLPDTLRVLSAMYTEQTEMKIRLVPAVIVPVFMLVLGSGIIMTVFALFLPLIRLVQGVSGN